MGKKNVTQKIIEKVAVRKPAVKKKLPKFIPGNPYTFDGIKVFAVAPSRNKGSFIVEDEDGAAYTVLLTELEPYNGEEQYNAGFAAGSEWAAEVEEDIHSEIRYRTDESSDYAKGYLKGVKLGFDAINWDYNSIMGNE